MTHPRHRREPASVTPPPAINLRPIDFHAVAPLRPPAVPRRKPETPAISTSDSLILGRS